MGAPSSIPLGKASYTIIIALAPPPGTMEPSCWEGEGGGRVEEAEGGATQETGRLLPRGASSPRRAETGRRYPPIPPWPPKGTQFLPVGPCPGVLLAGPFLELSSVRGHSWREWWSRSSGVGTGLTFPYERKAPGGRGSRCPISLCISPADADG